MRNASKQRRSARGWLPCRNTGAISVSRDRRRFISGVAAGLGALACASYGRVLPVFAQILAKTGLIDVHHHFVPPFYLAENREQIVASGGGRINPAWLSWSPQQALAAMDEQGVATAVLSLTYPGVW